MAFSAAAGALPRHRADSWVWAGPLLTLDGARFWRRWIAGTMAMTAVVAGLVSPEDYPLWMAFAAAALYVIASAVLHLLSAVPIPRRVPAEARH
jgi:hypothetical protein